MNTNLATHERPACQSLMNAPTGMPTNELLSLMTQPLAKRWTWAKKDLEGWAMGGKPRPVYAASNDRRFTIRGAVERDDAAGARFQLELHLSPKVGRYWTTTYVGVVTARSMDVYQRTTLDDTEMRFAIDDPPEELFLPLRAAVASGRFIDGGYPVTGSPHGVTEPIDVRMLIDALDAEDRTLPILVMTEGGDGLSWPMAKTIASELSGVAHVVTMIDPMTYMLSDAISKRSSVYKGYARLYAGRLSQDGPGLVFNPAMLAEPDATRKIIARIREESNKIVLLPPQIDLPQDIGSTIRILEAKKKSSPERPSDVHNPRQASQDDAPKAASPAAEAKEVASQPRALDGEHLGSSIRARRERLGLSQAQLGKLVGMSQVGILSVERRERPQSGKLQEILDALAKAEAMAAGDATEPKAPEVHPTPIVREEVVERAEIRKTRDDEQGSDDPTSVNDNATSFVEREEFDRLAVEMIGRTDRRIKAAVAEAVAELEAKIALRDEQISALGTLIEELRRAHRDGPPAPPAMPATEAPAAPAASATVPTAAQGEVTLSGVKSIEDLKTAAELMAQVAQTMIANYVEGTSDPKDEAAAAAAAFDDGEARTGADEESPADLRGYPPLTPAGVREWLDQWPDAFVLHPRAIDALKTAKYERTDRLYESLRILAEEYVPMRRGEPAEYDRRKRFEERLQALNLRYEAYKQTNRATYLFPYDGGKRAVEGSIKTNTFSMDQRKCMRIYTFWDDERRKIVVAHLPSHLPQVKEIS